jgi:hypothetical protein
VVDVGDVEADEEIADDGSHFALAKVYHLVLAVVVALEVVAVYLLAVVVETVTEQPREI